MAKYRMNFCVFFISLSLALVACKPAQASAAATTPSSTATSPTAAAAPTLKATSASTQQSSIELPSGIELEFWHPWSGELANVVEEMAVKFNQSNKWQIEITTAPHADDLVLLEDINQAYESEALPDIVAAPSAYLRLWQLQGLPIQDLQEFMESDTLGFTPAEQNAFLPVFWNTDVFGGLRLGIPAYRYGHFLFYNQSWASELGYSDQPLNSQEFRTQACAAAFANLAFAGGTGGWFYDTQPLTTLAWLQVFNAMEIITADASINLEQSGSQAALEYVYDMFLDDCAWIGKQSDPYQYFATRYALAYSGTNEDILIQEIANQTADSTDRWRLIPYPSDSARPVVYAEGASYAILKPDAIKARAAWLFLKYMVKPENQARMIEVSAAWPLSNTTIPLLSEFQDEHPAWQDALQLIPLAKPAPSTEKWAYIKPVFSDLAWQLIQYNSAREDIPFILEQAQDLIEEITPP